MPENENAAATEQATEANDTQITEEVTEAVETQSPADDQAVEEKKDESAAPAEKEEETVAEEEHEISYHAVEKEGAVTAIWEMQGPKHLRTIDPRSNEGKKILSLFETV